MFRRFLDMFCKENRHNLWQPRISLGWFLVIFRRACCTWITFFVRYFDSCNLHRFMKTDCTPFCIPIKIFHYKVVKIPMFTKGDVCTCTSRLCRKHLTCTGCYVLLTVLHRASWENLLKHQDILPLMIISISFILMTWSSSNIVRRNFTVIFSCILSLYLVIILYPQHCTP